MAAQWILALARESLDMMKKGIGVMKDCWDCAEAYVFIFDLQVFTDSFLDGLVVYGHGIQQDIQVGRCGYFQSVPFARRLKLYLILPRAPASAHI